MTYQHPLHYLIGIEGAALLRAFAGDCDREFAEARIAEIRRLLSSTVVESEGVTTTESDVVGGYRVWSDTYDGPNGLFAFDEPIVHEIVDGVAPGNALDAACGTGRFAEYLAARGHQVIGVDSSPEMLARARVRVAQGRFHEGQLHELPLPDDHIDIAVCALAMSHVRDLRPAFAELARVLRPGGHLIVTDIHQEMVALGSVPHVRAAGGQPQLIASYRHRASDYLDAALRTGLLVRSCHEPRHHTDPQHAEMMQDLAFPPWDSWPWSLLPMAPAAYSAVWNGTPAAIIWHFQLAEG